MPGAGPYVPPYNPNGRGNTPPPLVLQGGALNVTGQIDPATGLPYGAPPPAGAPAQGMPRFGLDRYQGILNGRNPYGQMGRRDVLQYDQNTINSMPDWLRSQFHYNEYESGGPGQWEINSGGLNTQDGRQAFRLGENEASDEFLDDPDAVWYDDYLGLVTDPRNVRQQERISDTDVALGFLSVLGGGLWAEAAGIGANGATFANEGVGAGTAWATSGSPGWAAEGGNIAANTAPATTGGLGGLSTIPAGPAGSQAQIVVTAQNLAAQTGMTYQQALQLVTAGGAAASAVNSGNQPSNNTNNNNTNNNTSDNTLRDYLRYGRQGMSLINLLNGGQGGNGRSNNGGGGMPSLMDLLLGGGAYAAGRNNLGDYKEGFSDMMRVGTGGVTPEDRAGARNTVRGIYDGSISGDQLYDMIPGLSALSERGRQNIGRKYSARGQGQSQDENAGWQRDFLDYDKELTSKHVGEYIDRAAKIGGYNIDPSQMAGRGLQALGDIYGRKNDLDSGLAGLLGRGSRGGGDGNFLDDIGGIWNSISRWFDGEGDPTDWPEIYDNTDGWWDTWGDDAFAGP
jgi:hypothetical protein